VRILQRMSTSKRSMAGLGRVSLVGISDGAGDGDGDGDFDGFCMGEEDDPRRHNDTGDDETLDNI